MKQILATCLLAAFAAVQAPVAMAASAKDDIEQVDPLAKKITGSKNYVSMFGIRASIASGFQVVGFFAVDAGLDIEKAKTRKQVKAIKPRLMDAMRQSVATYANGPYRPGQAPNLDALRARMQRAVDRQIGAGEAKVVLASVIIFEREN